jgi:hypothetical protein
MQLTVGAALLTAFLLALWLAMPRGGQVVAMLRSDNAQSLFMMVWIVVALVGAAFVIDGLMN